MMLNSSDACSVTERSESFLILAVFSIFSGLLAIGGNGIVLLAIYRTRALRTTSNLFIASLAASDWLVGSVMDPILVYKSIKYSYFGNTLSEYDPFKIGTDFLWIQAILVTTFGLTSVSVDRFVAITRVFHYNALLTVRRAACVIIFNWTFSFMFASLRLFLPEDRLSLLWISTAVLSCGLPFTVTSYCYISIFKAARTQMRRIVNETTAKETRRSEEARHRKTACTIGIVITLFCFLWFPSLVIASINLTLSKGCTKVMFSRRVWLWVEVIAYTSSAINPWVYSMRSVEFRAACKQSLGIRRTGIAPVEGASRSKARPSLVEMKVDTNGSYYGSNGINVQAMCPTKQTNPTAQEPSCYQYQNHLLPPVV